MPAQKHRRPGRPRTTGKNPMIAIRWPKPLYEGIARYAKARKLDRSDALRDIVAKYLIEQGIMHERLQV